MGEDEEIIAGNSCNKIVRKRVLSSSSDDESEDDKQGKENRQKECYHPEPSSSKNFRRIKRTQVMESSDEEDEKKNQKHLRTEKLKRMARKKNPEETYDTSTDNEEENGEKEESEEEEEKIDEITKVFTAKFSKICDLPGCNERHIQGVTKITGVRIFDKRIGDYIKKIVQNGRETPYWVCASHSKFYNDEIGETYESTDDENSEEDIKDFIDDEREYDSASNEST